MKLQGWVRWPVILEESVVEVDYFFGESAVVEIDEVGYDYVDAVLAAFLLIYPSVFWKF